MSKVICIAGESGSGKTTSMRNLDPKTTYYIDADCKGLSWKGWRNQYNTKINESLYSTQFTLFLTYTIVKYFGRLSERKSYCCRYN